MGRARQIAFQSNRDLVGGQWDIWIVNADGTNPQNLTQNPGVDDTRPVWSPDGTRIAFQSDDDAIWVLELEAVSTSVGGPGDLGHGKKNCIRVNAFEPIRKSC